jgi:hypothetical protein
MTDIVLVHGTTQSAAGFAGLVAALAERGHRALTVDVPSAAATTASEYGPLLAAQLPADLDAPVVVAHSAGGLLLPALARETGARHQVWLAAVVPDHRGRRSFLAELQTDSAAVVNLEWIGVDPVAEPGLATYFLFHDAGVAALRAALPTPALCDLSGVYAAMPEHDPAALPSTYLLPVHDRTLRPEWMARVALERLGVEPVELPGGHNAYAGAPDRVAHLIAAAAAS